jgi:hypothetical protein
MPSQWLKLWFPHFPNALDRAPLAALMCAGALLLGVALAGARSTASNGNDPGLGTSGIANVDVGDKNSTKLLPLSEGEEFQNRIGRFSIRNSRIVCTIDGKQNLTVLENQTLGEVAKKIAGSSTASPWSISGKITEFQGKYFLLLSAAEMTPTSVSTTDK